MTTKSFLGKRCILLVSCFSISMSQFINISGIYSTSVKSCVIYTFQFSARNISKGLSLACSSKTIFEFLPVIVAILARGYHTTYLSANIIIAVGGKTILLITFHDRWLLLLVKYNINKLHKKKCLLKSVTPLTQ